MNYCWSLLLEPCRALGYGLKQQFDCFLAVRIFLTVFLQLPSFLLLSKASEGELISYSMLALGASLHGLSVNVCLTPGLMSRLIFQHGLLQQDTDQTVRWRALPTALKSWKHKELSLSRGINTDQTKFGSERLKTGGILYRQALKENKTQSVFLLEGKDTLHPNSNICIWPLVGLARCYCRLAGNLSALTDSRWSAESHPTVSAQYDSSSASGPCVSCECALMHVRPSFF